MSTAKHKPHAAAADGIGSDVRVMRPNVGAGSLARHLASVVSLSAVLATIMLPPPSRRLYLLFDKLPKEPPSGVYAPPLVTLDLDFSAIRKEGAWSWPHALLRHEIPASTDIKAAIAVASASHRAEQS